MFHRVSFWLKSTDLFGGKATVRVSGGRLHLINAAVLTAEFPHSTWPCRTTKPFILITLATESYCFFFLWNLKASAEEEPFVCPSFVRNELIHWSNGNGKLLIEPFESVSVVSSDELNANSIWSKVQFRSFCSGKSSTESDINLYSLIFTQVMRVRIIKCSIWS